eukprot:scaffold20571_cov111-Isochrysis_galbana.AAC.3
MRPQRQPGGLLRSVSRTAQREVYAPWRELADWHRACSVWALSYSRSALGAPPLGGFVTRRRAARTHPAAAGARRGAGRSCSASLEPTGGRSGRHVLQTKWSS